jgi:predicted kinase
MLYILAGLPGVGKSSLGRELARRAKALYLRIDTIEWALAEAGHTDADDPSGYLVGYAVAKDNLRLGSRVVADSVNPLAITRSSWRQVAADAGVASAEIEVICSDPDEHRRRVESLELKNQTRRVPTWQQVREREYEPWQTQRFVIDTAGQSAAQSAESLITQLAAKGSRHPRYPWAGRQGLS